MIHSANSANPALQRLNLRKAEERGKTRVDWLESYHSFSFADYHDALHMGFGALRVINDDVIAPGAGFGMHGHRDMEIMTLVLSGALEHGDSIGNGAVIHPDEAQRMSAGTGIQHSEYNASADTPVRLLQIWILPDQRGLTPSYEQKKIDPASMQNRFALIAAPKNNAERSVITIHQNLRLYRAKIDSGKTVPFSLRAGRSVWLQMAEGEIVVNENTWLKTGDALSGQNAGRGDAPATVTINLHAKTNSDVLIFEQDV